jgi:hypothetical protein
MTFLPIVVRELRVASRRRGMYLARATTAFSAIALVYYLLFIFRDTIASTTGAFLFNFLVSLCSIICLTMVTITSDCISEEKRENTLGLLFLTDLKGYDVTLGKLFSNSLVSFYSILGILPVVAVTLLFGAVSMAEFIQVALGILNLFFFSQATGLLVSTFSQKRRSSSFWASIILVVYTGGFYLISLGLRHSRFRQWAEPFEWMNPTYPIYYGCTAGSVQMSAFARKFSYYWTPLLLIHLNAWIFLAAASWWMPRCWQERPVKPRVGLLARLRRWYDAKCVPRAKLLGVNPFLWLSVRNRLGSSKVWATLFVFNAVWLIYLLKYGFHYIGVPMCVLAVVVHHVLIKLFVAAEAAGNIEEQRRSGGLEFLLTCTPLKVEEIIAGQWAALSRLFLAPMVAVLLADLIYLALAQQELNPHRESTDFAAFIIGAMIMLVLDYFTLGSVGMWKGMIHRKSRGRAAGAAIAQVLILPWIILFFIVSLLANNGVHGFGDLVAIWFMVGLGTDGFSAMWAEKRLREEFRARAAIHGEEPIGLLGKLGRALGVMARPQTPRH